PAQRRLPVTVRASWGIVGIPTPLHLPPSPKGRYWGPFKLHSRTSQTA
ncbi:hypothetical protein PANDA_014593, partial [Ailuropoda melanoleuca]